jgi:hypothetical protein
MANDFINKDNFSISKYPIYGAFTYAKYTPYSPVQICNYLLY